MAGIKTRVPCSIASCDRIATKRGWCGAHYKVWREHGDPLAAKYTWSARTDRCAACGAESIAPNMRRYCSKACQQAVYRERGRERTPPQQCAGCGVSIRPYRSGGKSVGRVTDRYCGECRPKFKVRRSYRLAARILAHYQGTDCGICGDPIDMELRFPNKRSASIDHIVPLSMGGSDEVTNLRLAHFDCNVSKGNLRSERCL